MAESIARHAPAAIHESFRALMRGQIERADYDVFTRRATTSTWFKLAEARVAGASCELQLPTPRPSPRVLAQAGRLFYPIPVIEPRTDWRPAPERSQHCRRGRWIRGGSNEEDRLAECLRGAMSQAPHVAEIVIADGGSRDNTLDLVREFARRDPRIRIVEAAPAPARWNGKVSGLHAGERAMSQIVEWLLLLDADVDVEPALAAALLATAGARVRLSGHHGRLGFRRCSFSKQVLAGGARIACM
jgi:hypothetical protein